MAQRVLIYPNPLLRRGGRRVEEFGEDLRQTAEAMLQTMYEYRGVGLAAPQIGIDLSLLVLNPTGNREENDEEMVIVNPEIKSRKKLEYGEEGCLSFPGIYAEVERHRDIVVHYHDLGGTVHEAAIDGFLARIVQHEADHLQGTLFVDRLSSAERVRVRSKLLDLEKRFRTDNHDAD